MEPGWRATWEDSENDFVFCDGERPLGRVYIHGSGGIINGRWRWFFGALSGTEESRREALLAVEEAYERRQG